MAIHKRGGLTRTPAFPGASRPPTITDVAAAVGVGRSTVSRALTGSGPVSEEVRTRVREVAEALGYVPNGLARSLRVQVNRTVGLLISDVGNAFYAEVASGAQEALAERGYGMLLGSSRGDLAEASRAIQAMRVAQVPGVILIPVSRSSGADQLHRAHLAVVQVDRVMSHGGSDAVLLENEVGAFQATSHLIELGHRRIAMLVGETAWTTGRERLTGYRRALEEHGLRHDERIVVLTSFSTTHAQELTAALLSAHPDLTAIFAASNVLAEGALMACRAAGVQVPADLSIVAFDDLPWMSLVDPPLTTVAQPTLQIGRTAAGLLLDRLEGRHPEGSIVIRLPPSLVIRASTARVR